MEEDLRSRLLADEGISTAVKKASIAWGDRPQASGLPGITLEVIGGFDAQHMTDFQPLQSTQVQADVWSRDRLQARDLRRLVIAALVPAAIAGSTSFRRSFVDRRASSFEVIETGTIYRERIDFTVWHSAAP